MTKKSITSFIVGVVLSAASSNLYAEDLAQMYQLALQSDPVVQKAKAQALAAKEGITQARSILLPQINAQASYTDNSNDTQLSQTTSGSVVFFDATVDTTRYQYGASLNMQLYHHDSWLRMDNAKKQAHQSDIAFQLAKQDLILRVTQAYFDVLKAKDDLEFAKAEQTAIERQLEQTKQRFAVGLTAITDVHEAQAQFDNAVASVIKAENNVFNAEEALRTITNRYPESIQPLDTATFSTSNPMPATANEWQQIAESKNLELILQKIAMDIAKENINIAQSGHYPTLDLNGSLGSAKSESSYNALGTEFNNDTPYYDSSSVGITLTVPIYSGGRTSSAVRQAQQSYVATSQDLELAHREVVRKTRNAFNTVRAAISGIKALEQSVVSAKSALKATEAGFEVGTRTIVDVLNSTRNLYNAKRNLSSTRYGYIQSILALKRAAGTISEQDIIDINKGLAK
jgi:outer membrane protein